MALERQVVTISKGIEVLEHEGQRVLINPVNREWIKLADYAYDLALNPEGKPVSRLIEMCIRDRAFGGRNSTTSTENLRLFRLL